MSNKRYLKVPTFNIFGFGFQQFAEHVVNHSPAYGNRIELRLGFKALDAIAAADADGVAEMEADAAELFARATDVVRTPDLTLQRFDPVTKLPLGDNESTPVPKTAFNPFYEAIEAMSERRPEPPLAIASAAE